MDESAAAWVFDDDEPAPKPGREAPAKKSAKHFQPAVMDRAAAEVNEMIQKKDWSSGTPRHFVALYHQLHARVYGFEPVTSTQDRVRGAMLAGVMLKRQFDGDPVRMAVFMQWVWNRERWREKLRKAKGEIDGFRIGLRLQFSPGMADDHRVAMMRLRAQGK